MVTDEIQDGEGKVTKLQASKRSPPLHSTKQQANKLFWKHGGDPTLTENWKKNSISSQEMRRGQMQLPRLCNLSQVLLGQSH